MLHGFIVDEEKVKVSSSSSSWSFFSIEDSKPLEHTVSNMECISASLSYSKSSNSQENPKIIVLSETKQAGKM